MLSWKAGWSDVFGKHYSGKSHLSEPFSRYVCLEDKNSPFSRAGIPGNNGCDRRKLIVLAGMRSEVAVIMTGVRKAKQCIMYKNRLNYGNNKF